MFFGPSGRVHGPQNQLFLTLETKVRKRIMTKNDAFVNHIMLGNLEILVMEKMKENMNSISSKSHEMAILNV